MPADVISIRLEPETRATLDEVARRDGTSRSALVQRLLEEGVRMDAHPGIVFRDGPAGRRAAVAGGPDVWEIVRVVENVDARGEARVADAAAWLDLPAGQVSVAVDYYAAFRDEVDAWIERIDRAAAEAESAARARADVLK